MFPGFCVSFFLLGAAACRCLSTVQSVWNFLPIPSIRFLRPTIKSQNPRQHPVRRPDQKHQAQGKPSSLSARAHPAKHSQQGEREQLAATLPRSASTPSSQRCPGFTAFGCLSVVATTTLAVLNPHPPADSLLQQLQRYPNLRYLWPRQTVPPLEG